MTLDPKVSRELARIKQQRLGREAKARGLPAIALVSSNASTTNDRPPETALESTKASEFSIRAIRWFWPGRLALGKLGLIGGLPDKGKGLISADIIARCTTGAEWKPPNDRWRSRVLGPSPRSRLTDQQRISDDEVAVLSKAICRDLE